jgi:hypothetical protein
MARYCLPQGQQALKFKACFAALLLTVCSNIASLYAASANGQSPSQSDADNGAALVGKARLVGVVIAKDSRPGDRISGSILVNPNAYTDIPGLRVVKTAIPMPVSQRRKVLLKGLIVDTGGTSQWADNNFTAQLPQTAAPLSVTLRRGEENLATVQMPIDSAGSPPISCGLGWTMGTTAGAPTDYRTPASYCFGGVEVITGPFSGDTRLTRIDIGGLPAHLLAETPREVYWVLPPHLRPGPNQVTLHEGNSEIVFRVRVPRLDIVERVEDSDQEIDVSAPATGQSGQSSSAEGSGLLGIPIDIGIGVGFGGGGGGGRREFQEGPHTTPDY